MSRFVHRAEPGAAAYPDEPQRAGAVAAGRHGQPVVGSRGVDGRSDSELWADRTRIFLQPVAAPSILGLFGFMGATLIVGSNLAGWWGTPASILSVFPFALIFGGIAQFLAGMWSYKARDGLATAMHGTWGSFWIAYGVYYLLVATHVLFLTPMDVANPAFAWWFIVLCLVTMMGALAALGEGLGLFTVLSTLAVGSGFFAAGLWGPLHWAQIVAGWLFVISAMAAWYTASAMMLENSFGRTILPTGKYKVASNVPGRMATQPIQYAAGMPGVKVGQ